jgi:hypothetical protein
MAPIRVGVAGDQAEGDLTTASRNVDDHLADECGL